MLNLLKEKNVKFFGREYSLICTEYCNNSEEREKKNVLLRCQ